MPFLILQNGSHDKERRWCPGETPPHTIELKLVMGGVSVSDRRPCLGNELQSGSSHDGTDANRGGRRSAGNVANKTPQRKLI